VFWKKGGLLGFILLVLGTTPHVRLFPHVFFPFGGGGGGERLGVLENKTERRIFSDAQYMTVQKCFSHPSVSSYLVCVIHIKLVHGCIVLTSFCF
jgi:hypothetical protein